MGLTPGMVLSSGNLNSFTTLAKVYFGPRLEKLDSMSFFGFKLL